jgi:hypothetical protein
MTHPVANRRLRDDRRTRHVRRQRPHDGNQGHYREGGAERNYHRFRHGAAPHPIYRHRFRGYGNRVGYGQHRVRRAANQVGCVRRPARRDVRQVLHVPGRVQIGATRMEPAEC